MKEQRVKIESLDSAFIEKLFFEYNACLKILGFLTAREETKENHLQRYINLAERRNIELEIAKNEISSRYCPKGLINYSFSFDFDKEEIVYSYE